MRFFVRLAGLVVNVFVYHLCRGQEVQIVRRCAQTQQFPHAGFAAGHQFFHLFGKGVNAAGQNKVCLARHDEAEQVLFQMPLHLGFVLVKQLADSAGAFFRTEVA